MTKTLSCIEMPSELDTHAAVNFLLEKVDTSGWHNIVAIPPDSKPIGRTFAPGQAAAMFDFVDTHNGTANLYFSVNEPRPNAPHDKLSAADIAAARAVHVDLDPPAGADLAADRIEYIRRVSSAPLPPTFLIDSGGGIQAFWKLAEKVSLTDPSWLRDLNEAACVAFDGDPAVKNVDRIMRLPHTLNIPTPTKLKKHPERRARMAELVDASGPTHAPDKLKAAFPARAVDRVKKSEQPLVELDLPANIERAKHYLVNLAPEAIEGAGGNETTFRVAARCRDYALSEAQALDVMLDHWNEQKASPPWQPEDLASVVGNAFTYATGGWGSALAAAEFEVLDIDVDEFLDVSDGDAVSTSAEPDPVDLWARFDPPHLAKGLLPPLLEDFARARAVSIGVDPGGIAAATLAVCAAAISDSIKLKMKRHDDWTESARIWVALVGDPSAKKSPILSAAASPLRRMDSRMAQKFFQAKNVYDDLSASERKGVAKPAHKRLIIEDTTIEAAQEILAVSPDGLLCLQDELSGWFGSMDKYSGARGAAKDRSFWLQSFNGGHYSTARITRGATDIPNLSVCMLGGIQPDAIRKVTEGGVDDGLLQRLFPIVLQRAGRGQDVPQPPHTARYQELIEQLARTRPPHGPETDGIVDPTDGVLRFDDDAQRIREEMDTRFDNLADVEVVNKKLAAHILKLNGLFGRLCIIWHCVEHVGQPLPRLVSATTARRVAAFIEKFLLPHAIAFYAGVLGLSEQHEELAATAGYILAHPEKSELSFRDLQRGDRKMQALDRYEGEKTLERLEYFGWLRSLPPKKPGMRPKWRVNARVHELYRERGLKETARRQAARSMIAELASPMSD